VRLVRAVFALVVLQLVGCGRTPVAEKPYPTAGRPTLKLLSYNVNFGVPGDADTLAAIRGAAADLVLLQETNMAWERALRAQLAAEYPCMVFKHRGGAGGLALLARRAPLQIEILPPASAAGGWFPAVRAVIDAPFGRLQILGVHLRPPVSDGGSWVGGHFSTPKIRAAEIEFFYSRLAPKIPTVVAGDFNEEEDGDAAKFLMQMHFASALARYAPGQFTWRWPTMVGELHKQLDHVFVSSELEVLSAEIRLEGSSDHVPVITVIARAR
jgi:endonuclease/exonuclease/phosphatase (EEP) superfamily protein YafD